MSKRLNLLLSATLFLTCGIPAITPDDTSAMKKPLRCSGEPYGQADFYIVEYYVPLYFNAIKHGGFTKPSKVNSWQEAWSRAVQYRAKGDDHNAGIRALQALVIVEQTEGIERAVAVNRAMNDYIEKHLGGLPYEGALNKYIGGRGICT